MDKNKYSPQSNCDGNNYRSYYQKHPMRDRRGNRSNPRNYRGYNSRQPPERTFDYRGTETLGYCQQNRQEASSSQDVSLSVSPLEKKAKNLLDTVFSQQGIRSKLIILETIQNPLQNLQGNVDYYRMSMTVEPNQQGQFVLKIDQEEIAKGDFPNKQAAKSALGELALNSLKNDCFYIIKKDEYEEVSARRNDSDTKTEPPTSFEGSKAHRMMLKMGWGGKGLGSNEQGAEKTVAETINENITRQGLGTDNVFKKIHNVLEDYVKSDKMTLLKFEPDFTSEERAHIHKIATKFGLKSKSEGKGDQRRVTITKKLNRGDLVFNLLTCGLENALYKLVIPSKFQHLWFEDDEEDQSMNYQPHFTN